MKFIKELFEHKNEDNGRKNITVFFLNLFLILTHLFLMVIYILVDHRFMFVINIFSLLLYFSSIFRCVKNRDFYIGLAFGEIWLHMLFAILSFGWTPCFQNWSFAIITAYFLPAFNSDNYIKDNKKALLFAIIVMLTYFIVSVLIYIVDVPIMNPLSNFMNRMLFMVNNLIAFFTIIMFAYFYTSSKNRKETELTRKADFDELTSLYNRYSINQIGNSIMNDAMKVNKPYNVAILDIDFFKSVNDNYGHASGDMVLIELTSILKGISKGKIISGRWGGEEFVILANHNVKYYEFVALLNRLRNKVIKNLFIIDNNQKIKLTVSIGAASVKEYESLEKAISIADEKLYKAKKSGRNKIVS